MGSFVPTLANRDSPTGVYFVDVTSFVEQVLANNSMPQEIAFRLESPGGNVLMDVDGDGGGPILTITYGNYPVITPTIQTLPDGDLSVDYSVSGTLPANKQADIVLDWAPADSYNPAVDTPTKAITIPVVQTPNGPVTVSEASLGTPPPNTEDILAVADPRHDVTDPNSSPSFDSTPYSPVVNPVVNSTTTVLTASSHLSQGVYVFPSGKDVSLTATVSSSAGQPQPTGLVAFTVNRLPIGTAELKNGQASLDASLTGQAVYFVTAHYPGSDSLLASDSNQITLQDSLQQTRQLLAEAQAQLAQVDSKIAAIEPEEEKTADEYYDSALGLLKAIPQLIGSTALVALHNYSLHEEYNSLLDLQSRTSGLAAKLDSLQFQMDDSDDDTRDQIVSQARSVASQLQSDRSTLLRIEEQIKTTTRHKDNAVNGLVDNAVKTLFGMFAVPLDAVGKFADLAAVSSHPNEELQGLKRQRELLNIEIEDLTQRIETNNPVPDGETTLNQLSQSVNLQLQGQKSDPHFSPGFD